MSFASRMIDRVVVQTPNAVTTTDIYGNDDESTADYWEGVEVRAYVWPASSGEDETDRETVQRQFDVYFPPSVSINANCRVVFTDPAGNELTCRVIGEPILYAFRRKRSHIVARVESVEG